MSESFIHEFSLRTTPHDVAVLDVRLGAARQLYNACLRESLRRLDLMRENRRQYQSAGTPERRRRAMRPLRLPARTTSSRNTVSIPLQLKPKRLPDRRAPGRACGQKIATRAFAAVKQHAYGGRGRPRFKRFGWLSSVEGKSNASCIRWRDGHVIWSGLKLEPLFDRKDKDGLEAHALSSRVKFLRLVKRIVHGKPSWSVQLSWKVTP